MDNSGLNGNELMENGTGNGYDNVTLNDKIKEINEIPENRISLEQLEPWASKRLGVNVRDRTVL